MRTRPCRTCHRVVFGICNSLFPFRIDFLVLRLKMASTCRTASSLTRGRPFLFFLQIHPWFSKLSLSLLEEVDQYETVLWRSAEHWCMNLFSRTQSHKSLFIWETYFLKMAEPGGKYGDMPPILKSPRIWLSADTGYMWVFFVVSSYFIPKLYQSFTDILCVAW
jgi:hypothetical protein